MAKTTYQEARWRMMQREKHLLAALKKRFDSIPEDILDNLEVIILSASFEVWKYVKLEGFDGWLYDTERARHKWTKGFLSTGKKFTIRLHCITILELVLHMRPRDSSSFVLRLLIAASTGLEEPVRTVAVSWNWLRHFDEEKRQQTEQEERKQRVEQREQEEREQEEFTDPHPPPNYKYTHPPILPVPPVPRFRRDNWAYSFEAAIESNEVWFEILRVNETANFESVKRNYHKLLKSHHTDVGGSKAKAQKIIAAFRVYERITLSS